MTNILFNEGKYEVTLDQRKLKTPKGKLFYVESEPLALAVAAEWDRQKTNIVPSSMHLTGLCYTVLDNPNKFTKEEIVNNIIKYLDTDTILYTSGEEDELYDLQLKEWQPILNWFCKKFDISIESSKDISGPKISMEAKDVLRKYLLSYNLWAVHGFIFTIEALKSVILGITCAERYISVEKAVYLSRLEEEYQVGKRWGRIEWSHELNQQDTQARVAAGILFIYVNSSSNLIKNKAQII
ncbi:ATP synthase mitochondrial F1 complex assembly factor 2, putative [Pediculus humanus corporis]|uniref:ATP synthase mitochondrial F1 complex assembly factor 2, putative n=1 Tax=Pediculus humanus subsp. corporis TaxID=121224 RepID=E0VF77_PEDHC|nr:ATP synthase mitochondrial F1 complex assembly factor 2, putative [Pediculus humanus corporis]EEB12033.1 ATP synthase mitochondrial F1 complex assembly factor 2, putative [Pediculus humanus corporis]